MKAIQITEFGGPDVMHLVDLEDPKAAEGFEVIAVDNLSNSSEEILVSAAAKGSAIIAGRTVEFAGFQALGFGGSGQSGFGRRNGLAGFLEFSHRRARVNHGNFSLSRLFDQPRGKAVERLKNFLAK